MAIKRMVFLGLLTLISSCTGYQPMSKALNYDQAIEETLLTSNGDRAIELHRCISNWRTHANQRQLFLDEMARNLILEQDKFVVLEIGNANFPRYDYVYIVDDLLNVTRPQEGKTILNITGTKLKEKIEGLSGTDIVNMSGFVSSDIDDGDCYFLTIGQRTVFKQVAIYGDLSSQNNASTLIREVMSHVRASGSPYPP